MDQNKEMIELLEKAKEIQGAQIDYTIEELKKGNEFHDIIASKEAQDYKLEAEYVEGKIQNILKRKRKEEFAKAFKELLEDYKKIIEAEEDKNGNKKI